MCLLCIAFIYLTYEVTTAWFLDKSTTSNGTNITIIGTLELDVKTNFNFYNLALQPDYLYEEDKDGQAIGTYIRTKNPDHNIDGAFVRIKYTTRRKLEDSTEWVDNSDLLSLYFKDNEDEWVYNDTDGYYYYLGSVFGDFVEFNKGYKVDYKIGNEYKNAKVEVDFQVEAIQRQYGAYLEVWDTAPDAFNTFAQTEMSKGEQVNGN